MPPRTPGRGLSFVGSLQIGASKRCGDPSPERLFAGVSLDRDEQTVEERTLACLAERLGEDIAAVVASGAIPLTDAEQAVLGDC